MEGLRGRRVPGTGVAPARQVKPKEDAQVLVEALRIVTEPEAQLVLATQLAFPPAHLLTEIGTPRSKQLLPRLAIEA